MPPVWILTVVILFRLAGTISYSTPHTAIGDPRSGPAVHFGLDDVVYLLVIISECVFYWQYRTRIRAKKLAWVHVLGMLLAFVIFPLVEPSIMPKPELGPDLVYHVTLEYYNQLRNVHTVVFWSLFILAHLFFAMLISRGLYKESTETSGQDLLGEFADKL